MGTLRQPQRHIVIGLGTFFFIACFLIFAPRPARLSLHSIGHGALYAPPTSSSRKIDRFYDKDYKGSSSPVDINRVTNETLGFEKILIVGLPERSDKRDAIALTSSLTGFRVEWVDGVKGETIPDKAVPFGTDRKKLWETNLGSWRGHMNAVRKIISEDISSALIMEDDMDWDVRLKPQLERVAQGARALLSSASKPNSPYGDDWDLMWLGHCGEVFPETLDENIEKPDNSPAIEYMSRKFVIEKDSTVPPKDRVTGLVNFVDYPEYTRWVHITGAPICTFAYALSQQGARKVLLDLSVDHLTGPFDNALAGLCRRAVSTWGVEDPAVAGDRGLDAKCISVTPPIFFHHKARGLVNGDSDIQTVKDGQIREKGMTENIVWSARNNIRNLIMGTRIETQYE
ncbi:glycosyltransferase family 25 protein [Annulohypoxylon maeteangense]|uniref:glycosyltransferase family 25 protein n=1 Tax=Annulohypoxylon maeteangense TaxID=1927788 RepID=UPI0020089C3A|nr:glycosyltransferase family 25 protein [Annulohypoxylon maeteangense]KAI0879842.1 glycosyltransferase family 25 protein [Annulohypoxylon maeteangense]